MGIPYQDIQIYLYNMHEEYDRKIDFRVTFRVSRACLAEKKYIAHILLEEFLGWDVEIEEVTDLAHSELVIPGQKGVLKIAEVFFSSAEECWLSKETLPNNELWCDDQQVVNVLSEEKIPVFFGAQNADGSWWKLDCGTGELGLDIFGSSFFFLSRYEEAVVDVRDMHGRFPSSASIASKWGILHRPVVNEYLEIFWNCVQQVWPDLERKPKSFRVLPSHDIDWPYQFLDVSWKNATWNCLRAAKHGKIDAAVDWGWKYLKYRFGSLESDPNHTIRWILDQSEKRGLKSAFYYIPQQTNPELDPANYLDHSNVMSQWAMILNSGHEIGVHPGYETYRSSEAIAAAVNKIRACLHRFGCCDRQIGGRQHFLRWKTPETARYCEHAGMAYDSTLGFADHAGFRCGTCYEYTLYDVVERRPLNLMERPLIVMDCTVVDEQYMGLGLGQQAYDQMVSLKEACRRYNGDFTILWHNQRFSHSGERELYTSILDA